MKKIICFIFIIFLQFSLTSCAKSANIDENLENLFINYKSNIENLEVHKAETKVYFAENKYVSFDISTDFIVEFNNDDIVLFDDNTAMARLYSNINITPSNKDLFKNYNGIYINPKTNKLLRKIYTGTKTLKLEETDIENFRIVNAMQITPIYENYENIGIAVYFPNNQEEEINYTDIKITNSTNSISSTTGTIFYTFLKDGADLSNITKTSFNKNIMFNIEYSTSENNINNIFIEMDMLFENNNFIVFNIIKSGEKDFYYLEMTVDDNNYYIIDNFNNPNLINFVLK